MLTIASCEDSESLLSSSAREPHAFLSELLTVITLQRLSSSEALSLSVTALESHLREQPLFSLCCISSVLSEPLFSVFFTLSSSLVSFCNLSFFSVVPSLGHRHSLCLETGLVRATPDQKLASVPYAARTRLLPQHLIKPTG